MSGNQTHRLTLSKVAQRSAPIIIPSSVIDELKRVFGYPLPGFDRFDPTHIPWAYSVISNYLANQPDGVVD
ncbi:MAG: hypothetical protein ACKO96_19365, partial [Flammeovirgaceae bacterium]